jgi:hypothetical protein
VDTDATSMHSIASNEFSSKGEWISINFATSESYTCAAPKTYAFFRRGTSPLIKPILARDISLTDVSRYARGPVYHPQAPPVPIQCSVSVAGQQSQAHSLSWMNRRSTRPSSEVSRAPGTMLEAVLEAFLRVQ